MKNTWKGIKFIISVKVSESGSLETIVNSNGEFLTNPIDIANSFNNFFCSVVPNIQSTINQTFRPFHYYQINPCVDSLCTKKLILEIVSNFDNDRATGINSIPLKILKLAKESIAEHHPCAI